MKKKVIKWRYIVASFFSVIACLGNAGMTYYMSRVIEEPLTSNFIKMSIFLVCSIMFAPVLSIIISYFVKKDKYERKEKIINSATKKRMLFIESEKYNNKVNFLNSNNQERDIFNFFCNLSAAGAYLLAIMFLLSSYLTWYWVVLDILIYLFVSVLSVWPNLKLANLMGDFWVNYIQNTRYYNYISDVLSKREYAEEKKIYGFFDFFVKKFDSEFHKAAKMNKELGKKRIILEETNNLVNIIFIIFEVMFLAMLCIQEIVPVSFFVAILPFAISAYSKVCIAMNSFNSISQVQRYMNEEREFLEMEKKEEGRYEEKDYAIKLNGISFRYPDNDRLILDNISFNFEKGKKYAIVGVNGCGKTTLAKLISGLYEPQKGLIESSGEVAILFQDFVKYPFSIGENVALQKEYDANKIKEILELLGLNTKMEEMKNGLKSELTNTKVDGINLSGGQWQRLALARMLYISNDIVILDEPTASLDPKIEVEIYREYMKCFSNKTVIFITHRLGYIKNVDEILVLNNGIIEEKGTPIDLLNNQSTFFYQLFEEQRSIYEK